MRCILSVKAGDGMFWLLMALLAAYAAFLEIHMTADFHHFDVTQAQIRLRIGGVHKTWRILLLRTKQGHRVLLAGDHSMQPLEPGQLRQSKGSIIVGAIRRADLARRFLLHHTHLDRLDAHILLRTEDAARTAVLSGTLRGILGCIPALHRRNVRIRILPDFFRAHSTVNARCIIRLRLGILLLTAVMLLAAAFRKQRLTESEAV